MAHAKKCPVCLGTGKVFVILEGTTYGNKDCYGCQGRGWVEVSDPEPPKRKPFEDWDHGWLGMGHP